MIRHPRLDQGTEKFGMAPLSPSDTEIMLSQVGINPGKCPELWRMNHASFSSTYMFVGPCLGAPGDERYVGFIRRRMFEQNIQIFVGRREKDWWYVTLNDPHTRRQPNAEGLTEAHALVLAAKKVGILE